MQLVGLAFMALGMAAIASKLSNATDRTYKHKQLRKELSLLDNAVAAKRFTPLCNG